MSTPAKRCTAPWVLEWPAVREQYARLERLKDQFRRAADYGVAWNTIRNCCTRQYRLPFRRVA